VADTVVLEMHNIDKSFPGVHALKNVHFDVRKGEIHALIGQNGAGKSTLLKILAGIYHPDEGTISINGNNYDRWTPHQIMGMGVSFIYQELNLFQDLSVAQNLFIGRELTRIPGVISQKEMRVRAKKALARLDATDIPVDKPVKELSAAKQQIVAIAKAFDQNPSLLVLDEPTSRLGLEDSEKLFAILNKMRDQGLSIIYVSHRLGEIYRISDRITVLRDGCLIKTDDAKSISPRQLVQYMVGEDVLTKKYVQKEKSGNVLLKTDALAGDGFQDVTFELHAGEVLGLVGAVGAGKTEMVRVLFGIDLFESGMISVQGNKIIKNNPQKAIANGIALCPEDRKYQGLVLENSIRENITISSLKKVKTSFWLVDRKSEKETVNAMVSRLRIATPSIDKKARELSGGNQQKVVLAKWLCTDSCIFVFDEPTVGVDIQGKSEIYDLMHELANNGAGVLFVTSDIEEGLQVSDRLLVMYKGTIVKELNPHSSSLEEASLFAMGGNLNEKA